MGLFCKVQILRFLFLFWTPTETMLLYVQVWSHCQTLSGMFLGIAIT